MSRETWALTSKTFRVPPPSPLKENRPSGLKLKNCPPEVTIGDSTSFPVSEPQRRKEVSPVWNVQSRPDPVTPHPTAAMTFPSGLSATCDTACPVHFKNGPAS